MSSVLKERDPTLCLGHPHTLSCQVTRPQRAHPQTDRHTHTQVSHSSTHTASPQPHSHTQSLSLSHRWADTLSSTVSQGAKQPRTRPQPVALMPVYLRMDLYTHAHTHTHRPNRTGAKPVQSHADLQNPACPGARKPRRVQVHTGTQAPLWVSPGRWPALWRSALNPQRHTVTGAHSGWGLGR